MKPIDTSNSRTQEKMFPFTHTGWDEAPGDYGDIQFYNVEFTEDFGPIEKGQKFKTVAVFHNPPLLQAFNDDNDYIEVGWKAIVI